MSSTNPYPSIPFPTTTSPPVIAPTAEATFTFLPVVSSVSPNSGSRAGGQTVTITGAGFTGAGHVHFGKLEAASFTVISDTSIRAVTPKAPGAAHVHVRVTTNGAISEATSNDGYRFT